MISVLVPVYAVADFIERCARSLFEQTCKNLEYVFVNDDTTDNSIDILKSVIDEYPERREAIRIVEHEKNLGLAAARNTAMENATGEFVCLVDPDDWMELNALELLEKKQLESDADIVSGNRMVHFKNYENLFQERQYHSKQEMLLQMIQRSWDHLITGRLLRRSLFSNPGAEWIEGLDVAEDRYMMTILTYYAGRFDTVDAIVYHYDRRNMNAHTNNNDRQRILRGNNQELGNVLSLIRFFEDKEVVYQKACAQCAANQLKYNLNTALAYASKEEFYRIAGLSGRRGNYYLMRLGWLTRKTIQYLRRRLYRLFFSS